MHQLWKIGKILASEASRAVTWGGGGGGSLRCEY